MKKIVRLYIMFLGLWATAAFSDTNTTVELVTEGSRTFATFDPPVAVTSQVAKIEVGQIFAPSLGDTNEVYIVPLEHTSYSETKLEDGSTFESSTALQMTIKVTIQDRMALLGYTSVTNYQANVTAAELRASIKQAAITKALGLLQQTTP